jgi:hypothetical protein
MIGLALSLLASRIATASNCNCASTGLVPLIDRHGLAHRGGSRLPVLGSD